MSHILGWDTRYLYEVAVDGERTIVLCEEVFTRGHHGTLSPGGIRWEGTAAESAQDASFADLVRVRGMAEALRSAAAVARRGADQLDYLKRQAIADIDDAREAGFTVRTTACNHDRYLCRSTQCRRQRSRHQIRCCHNRTGQSRLHRAVSSDG